MAISATESFLTQLDYAAQGKSLAEVWDKGNLIEFENLLSSKAEESDIAEEVIEEIQALEQTTTTSTPTTVQTLLQLQYPFNCSASSSLGEGWSCEKIYDDEPSSWQDNGSECADATLEFTFSKDIYFQFLTYENIEDTKSFKRNHKPRDILITSEEEGFSIEYELENQNNSSQWIDLNTTSSVITIQILSAYPGEEVNGAEPFPECAIQEITFYGRG